MKARKALAFLHNDKKVVDKIFHDLAARYENRNGGYTQILKLSERRGDDALIVILKFVETETPSEEKKDKNEKKTTKKEAKEK